MATNPLNLSLFIPDLRDLTSIIRTPTPKAVRSNRIGRTTKSRLFDKTGGFL